MELYLAKTDPLETIVEHTDNLIDQYFILKNMYDIKSDYTDWHLIKLACIYHDIAKMNPKFQNKLRKKLGYPLLQEDGLKMFQEIYHNHLSPAFLPDGLLNDLSETDKIILFQAIYRHHKRTENTEDLKAYIKEIKVDINKFGLENSKHLKNVEIPTKLNLKYKKFIIDFITSERYYKIFIKDDYENISTREIENYIKPVFYKYVMTKGLLNKIDYAASTILEGSSIFIEVETDDVTGKTNMYLQHITKKQDAINDLQKYLVENVDENNVVIAATGFGKTEAGLLWLDNKKSFFTLPLKVSINAIFDRLIEKIGIDKEKVGLLHSDTFSELIKRQDEITEFDERYLSQTKQMSMPITVCTLDQLISFVFLVDGFEVKLATLAYSKIIIDEIQMYSPDYLACLIIALKYITDLGGKFTILTATLPPIIIKQLEMYNIPFKLATQKYYKNELRHIVKVFEQVINLEHLRSNFDDTKKYLIICNTVKKAQEIFYELLSDDFYATKTNINLLHSRFIKKDRKQKEDEIQRLGDKDCNDSGIWVTTQIVEASLDIDFDFLYAELSDISGFFQRMGRCFRNRVNESYINNVFVYVGDDKDLPSLVSKNNNKYSIDYGVFSHSKKLLIENMQAGIFEYTEKLKMDMVEKVYSIESLSESKDLLDSYYSKLNTSLNYLYNLEPYETVNEKLKLRDISQMNFIPLQVYIENQEVIDNLIDDLKKTYYDEKNERDQEKRKALKKVNKIFKQKTIDKIKNYETSCPEEIFYKFYFDKIKVNDYLYFYVGNFIYDNMLGLKYEKFEIINDVNKSGVDFF